MREEAGDLGKIVVYYAVWTIACATVAGLAVAILHIWRFSYHPTVASIVVTLVGDTEVALAVATGQGAAALATGGLLARGGRALQGTVLLGLLVGGFDLLLYVVQMLVPATELGWAPDMGILIAATVLITVYGAASAKLSA